MTALTEEEWFLLEGINPEPWTASEGSIGRKGGKLFVMYHKQMQLRVYQEAIQETFKEKYPAVEPSPAGQRIALEFYFWRELPVYEGTRGNVRKHEADVTNLQKALEDALQGILFHNDRDVKVIKSYIVEQEFDTSPKILICLTEVPDHEIEWGRRLAAGHASGSVQQPEKSQYDRPECNDVF
jgi:Holliday junction resolvase RusA-like endonuclease